MGKTKVFLDSNVFIYLFNADESVKNRRCIELLKQLEGESIIVISTQVVKEVSSVLIRKFNYPLAELKVFIWQ
ncbi:MAG: PIN domain-containing protein, partial [Akkermansiaceae bacterium]